MEWAEGPSEQNVGLHWVSGRPLDCLTTRARVVLITILNQLPQVIVPENERACTAHNGYKED